MSSGRWSGTETMAELRSFIFLDQLQPQTMCYLGTWVRGRLPRLNVAAQVIEIAPGLDIEPLTDVALKEASSAVLGALGVDATSATPPKVLASRTITSVDAQHAFLVNRNKLGSMVLPGESLFVLEMQPASYAILATNEAEKAAQIKLVDYRMIGATGRVYLSGREDDVRQASEAVTALLGEPG